MSQEMATWIFSRAQVAGVSENRLINRMLQIAREDLGPFDDAGFKRIATQPWHLAKKIPALSRQVAKRDHGHLHAVTATRLSMQEKQALRDLAEKNKTTMSGLQRQVIERLLAKER
jgi:hypothetical protein